MLKPRIIPCLLLKNNALVKTKSFKNPKYVGDPLNAVRIFNEKQVDELFIADIDATVLNQLPNFALIERITSQCTMPLCYAGGVTKVDDFQKLVSIGVEKVAVSSACITDPDLICKAANKVGSQSVVAVLDVKTSGLFKSKYVLTSHNSKVKHDIDIITHLKNLQSLGVGEIIINSVDRDGTCDGYDYDLIDSVISNVDVPLTVLGGASDNQDFTKLFSRYGLIGAAAGSLFVFKGKYRAVLIQYPSQQEKISFYP